MGSGTPAQEAKNMLRATITAAKIGGLRYLMLLSPVDGSVFVAMVAVL
jgi:hypothetical protein